MSVQILIGDCRDVLKTLPDESVHCVVTSPPYWGLRDYGVDGQIGLEGEYGSFVEALVNVFAEVRRVLRSDGTCWVNLGDSYATGAGKVGNCPGGSEQGERWRGGPPSDKSTLRGNGHIGGGPKLHALDPVPVGPMTQPNRMPQEGLKAKDVCGIPWRVAFALQADGWYLRQDIIWAKPNPMPESVRDRCTKAHEYLFLLSKSARYHFDQEAILFAEKQRKLAGAGGGTKNNGSFDAAMAIMPVKRNKRSVWTVGSEPFSQAHFATFPPALIEPCILAGCPVGGTVLDPFGGAGTTALVADRAGRNSILIELNPEYAAMAQRRIEGDAGMFAQVEAIA